MSGPVGIFDSGPGGLAVLLMMQRWLPHEAVLYVGDTARQPYELRPREQVCRIAVEITGFLVDQGVKLVIIGCNTATAAGLDAARAAFPNVPILGMIGPGVRAALRDSKGRRFGVLGSVITIDSHQYEERIRAEMPEAVVLGEVPSDLFRYTEKGRLEDRERLLRLTERYCRPFIEAEVDTLILGCTDLTCVRDLISETMGEDVVVIDPAEQVVVEARGILRGMDALREESEPAYRFLITGQGVADFARYAQSFLGLSQIDVRHVASQRVQLSTTALSHDCGPPGP